MFGALAEFERSLIRERTQAGLAAARRVGRTGGRPPKLTEEDLEAARAMLANPDIGVTQIAHRLGLSRDALSLHPRRANREYLRRLRGPLPKDRTPPDGSAGVVERRLRVDSGPSPRCE
jgi:DNA invertase Pin-like site-specific DNA recombinase